MLGLVPGRGGGGQLGARAGGGNRGVGKAGCRAGGSEGTGKAGALEPRAWVQGRACWGESESLGGWLFSLKCGLQV